jgi:Domain of unknown function (DUF5122) beta-propeller
MLLLTVVCGSARAGSVPDSTTPVLDQPVNAIAVDSQGRTYLGGSFNTYGPRLGSGAVFTTSSDTPAAGFPDVNGEVWASVSDGAGGEFIGGDFTFVGGLARNRLAHIRADHSVDPDWNPGAKASVRALALSGDALYVAGDFTGTNAVGSATRTRLAKVSATGAGAVDPDWAPTANLRVAALAVSGGSVFVGGFFNSVNGDSPPKLAKISATGTGATDPTWAGAVTGAEVDALAVSGNSLFVGGFFSQVGTVPRNNLAKVDTNGTGDADATWAPEPNGEVFALTVSGTDLFVGGGFSKVSGADHFNLAKVATGTGVADTTWKASANGPVSALAVVGNDLVVGGQLFQLDGADRPWLGAVDTAGAGDVRAWTPAPNAQVDTVVASGAGVFVGGFFSSAGPAQVSHTGLIRLKPDGTIDGSWPTTVRGRVTALALDGQNLFIGGLFTRVNNIGRGGLAKVSTETGSLDPNFNSGDVSDQVNALAVSGSSLFVGGKFFGANSIGASTRDRLARLNTTSGAVDSWDAGVIGPEVDALAVSGDQLIVGGNFSEIGGTGRSDLAKVSIDTATVDPNWDPSPTGPVSTLLPSGASVFVGGSFTGTIGNQQRNRIAKLSTSGSGDADPSWSANATNVVLALAQRGDDLYVGGGYTQIGTAPNAQPRNGLARVSATTGAVDAGFAPGGSNNGGAVQAIGVTGNGLVVGGSFKNIGALSTASYALFNFVSPVATLTSPADGARFRVGQVVNAQYSCTDDGPVTCAGNVPNGSAIDTATAGAKTFTVTATDTAGNSDVKSASYTVDGSAPAISIAVPSDGASLVAGTKLPVSFSCSDDDGAADVASCAGTAPNGSLLSTNAAGTHTFTVTAVDVAGNTTTKTVSYKVVAQRGTPVLSAFKIKPAKFRKSAKVSYKLSIRSSVTFTVFKKSGKKVGSFKRKSKKGANKFTFKPRVGKRTLKPGSYKMTARAKGPTGLLSKKVTRSFKVLKKR